MIRHGNVSASRRIVRSLRAGIALRPGRTGGRREPAAKPLTDTAGFDSFAAKIALD